MRDSLHPHDALKTLAASHGVSSRTIQRRCRVEGDSFRQVRERLRQTHATATLRDASIPIAEVARRLGFCTTPSFCRAFRRWFGMSARQARRLLLSGAAVELSPIVGTRS